MAQLQRIITTCALCLMTSGAFAHEPQQTQYLGNEALLVTQGETKVLFDPLFHSDYGQYQLISEQTRAAIMSATEPFDGIDVIFISHAHGDHFDAGDMNAYLTLRKDVALVAPTQAIEAMQKAAGWSMDLANRITAIDLDYGDAPRIIHVADLSATAVRIAHAGWPSPARIDVQNMVYRITFGANAVRESLTIMHMGDADVNPVHYTPYAEHWKAKRTDIAFIPYWFFIVPNGNEIVYRHLNVGRPIGIHVPRNVPTDLQLSGADYFSVPGELRVRE